MSLGSDFPADTGGAAPPDAGNAIERDAGPNADAARDVADAGTNERDAETLDAQTRDAAVNGIDLTASWPPSSAIAVAPGSALSLDLRVDNLGTMPAAGVRLRVMLCQVVCNARSQRTMLLEELVGDVPAMTGLIRTISILIPASIAPGSYEVFAVVDPDQTIVEVDETNNTTESLAVTIGPLIATPSLLDFGTVTEGCSAQSVLTLSNFGTTDVTMTSLTTSANEFAIVQNPLQVIIAPGGSSMLRVEYAPVNLGLDVAELEIAYDQSSVPLRVELRGEGVAAAMRTESFTQTAAKKIDVLFVVDNSCSMSEEQMALAENFTTFIDAATQNGVDYHIAVTTTDVEASGQQGRFVGSPTVITPVTPNRDLAFAGNVGVGTNGSGNEQGFEASKLALSPALLASDNAGFLRHDAALAVIYLSDENDYSPDNEADYVFALRQVKGGDSSLVIANAIVGPGPNGCMGTARSADWGERYLTVVQLIGGVTASICDGDWSAPLTTLGGPSFGWLRAFVLNTPADPTTIAVHVEGVPVPQMDANGVAQWSYDAARSAVVFTEGATPRPGSTITVAYAATCGP